MEKTAKACIVLAAGKGTRMKSDLPKVMHPIANKPMLSHVLATADALKPTKVVTVVGPNMAVVEKEVRSHGDHHQIVIQKEQLGTGHAVLQAKDKLARFDGIIYILYGDTPLILFRTLEKMASEMAERNADAAVLGLHLENPGAYGRLVINKNNELSGIIEAKDANEAQREIRWCNSGVMAVQAEYLFGWLAKVSNTNAKGEYYLTDIIALANADKKRCIVVEGDAEELEGVNDRAQLAALDAVFQRRKRQEAMESGVTLQQPETVYFSADTQLGRDVVVEPHVYFGPEVVVEDNVHIRAFSHIEGTKIASGAAIGPYARLRPGAEIGEDCRIGNFVEIKKALIEKGAKVSHLSYIGDARIGVHANIGAGTITCNYDGYDKFYTDIGNYAFIGSNTALIAPVIVGEGAIVAAGSIITEDVEKEALSLTRSNQVHRPGWAKAFRLKKQN